MAVIEIQKSDMEKLIGRKLTNKDVAEVIPLYGCSLEKTEKNKLFYEVSPNRPDMLSVEGFARAIKKFLGIKPGLEKYKIKRSIIKLFVDKSVKKVRPYVVAAVIRNVKFTDELVASLMQVQEKIHDTIGRKRKKVAIGVHDLEKVSAPFYYKAVAPRSLSFVPLGMKEKLSMKDVCEKHPKGIEYRHILEKSDVWPVIVDKDGNVLSFPPIINGELTKVTEKTRNLFIDITGLSEAAVNQALNILATALYDRGCEIETVDVIDGKSIVTPDLNATKIEINIDYINKILDLDLTKNELSELLRKMGFELSGITVLIPPYRTDIMHPIDIIEDVAIAYGYEKFEARIPKVSTIARRLAEEEFSEFIRYAMSSLEFQEVVNMILTNKKDEFEKMRIHETGVCETLNAISAEYSVCRKSLLPSAMKVFSQNQHNDYPQSIFEMGFVIVPAEGEETGAENARKLLAAIANSIVSYEDISSVLDAFMESIGIEYNLKAANYPSFIEGRCAEILVNSKSIGTIGEIHPQVLENWNLEKPVAAFELDVEKIFNLLAR